MLLGFVSDEQYVALADVVVEADRDGATIAEARSTARGRVNVDLPPGPYRITFRKDGFRAKGVDVRSARVTPPASSGCSRIV